MSSAKCPDCGRYVDLGTHPRLHEVVMCPHCDADLEVSSKDPPELDWAYADSGEWDDEEDEEDERERDEEKQYG